MSKEPNAGDRCACGLVIAFPKYHWPHCPANPVNMTRSDREYIESKFTKAELAIIAAHGSGQ